jgi:D-beta-D-heptose 7-phosphate kinase/D-beta-D-heptose 1-phosphate adenosyltransferase
MTITNNDYIVCVSGGFDPLHKGHVDMLVGASNFGKLVVILNSDQWLVERNGFYLMPWTERSDIIS